MVSQPGVSCSHLNHFKLTPRGKLFSSIYKNINCRLSISGCRPSQLSNNRPLSWFSIVLVHFLIAQYFSYVVLTRFSRAGLISLCVPHCQHIKWLTVVTLHSSPLQEKGSGPIILILSWFPSMRCDCFWTIHRFAFVNRLGRAQFWDINNSLCVLFQNSHAFHLPLSLRNCTSLIQL